MGLANARARSAAVRLLNCLYDGTNWQQATAHPARVQFVGEALEIDVATAAAAAIPSPATDSLNADADAGASSGAAGLLPALGEGQSFGVLVSAPPYEWNGPGGPEAVITLHAPDAVETETVWVPQVAAAPLPGLPSSTAAADAASRPAGGDSTSPQQAASAAAAAAAQADGPLSSGSAASPTGPGAVSWVRQTVSRIRLKLAPFTRCGESPAASRPLQLHTDALSRLPIAVPSFCARLSTASLCSASTCLSLRLLCLGLQASTTGAWWSWTRTAPRTLSRPSLRRRAHRRTSWAVPPAPAPMLQASLVLHQLTQGRASSRPLPQAWPPLPSLPSRRADLSCSGPACGRRAGRRWWWTWRA